MAAQPVAGSAEPVFFSQRRKADRQAMAAAQPFNPAPTLVDQ
jgi:hypothetical protein